MNLCKVSPVVGPSNSPGFQSRREESGHLLIPGKQALLLANQVCIFFYAMETYLTHFLEGARFPKALVLAGCKVTFYFTPRSVSWLSGWPCPPPPGWGGGAALHLTCTLLLPPHSVWALKQPLSLSYLILFYLIFSYLHKNTNEPVFLWRLAVMISRLFRAQNRLDFQPIPSNGPSNVFAPHQNHKGQAPCIKTGWLVYLCK